VSDESRTTATDSQAVEALRRAYELISRGDIEGVLELAHPEIEMTDRPEVPDPQTYSGHDGIREALGKNVETFEEMELVPERFIEEGNFVVVVLLMRGRGKESGVPVEDRIAHVWELRDGQAWRLQVYSDPEEAIALARTHG
jgi:ketosteroid isomerase-like protein